MEPYRFHLFACTQEKPEGVPSCLASGASALLEELDRQIQARGLRSDVQVTTCGCMGLCDEGPILVVYPEGSWYRRVRLADLPEIVETHLRDGRPLDRLLWNDAPAMKAMSVEHGERFRAAMAAREKAGTLPDHLYQLIRGYMPSRCILTALELDLFTVVGDGATAGQVAARVHACARAAAVLLNALVALGLLAKSGHEYRNTPETARFFVRGSKNNQRDGFLLTADLWHRWSTLTEAVRRGGYVPIERAHDPESTRNFIAGMDRNAQERAPLLVKALGTAGVRRVLDLGGGSGAYSIAFAKASTELRAEILDLPEVVPLTADYVARAGASARVSVRAGNLFQDDFGRGYDLILLNAICHMFSAEQNREIFRRARQALAPDGRLAVQEYILNPDQAGPLRAALFSVNMLVSTEAGASYGEQEYAEWMKAAGFAEVRRINLHGPNDLMVGQVK